METIFYCTIVNGLSEVPKPSKVIFDFRNTTGLTPI